ncbi:MAG: hypothetical protein KAH32_01935 [Chlamydiia bacterium]|nr:hypothetical protein [Chlamydiia bacterium]
MVRISKQNQRRSVSRRRPKYTLLNDKSGSKNSFPSGGYKNSNNAIDLDKRQNIVYISTTELRS